MSRDTNLSDFSMLELFRMELDTQLAVLNDGLLELEESGASPLLLESLMRASHSIKGAARMVDVNAAVRVSHIIEECFVLAQARALKLNHADIDTLLASVDVLAAIKMANDKDMLEWESTHEHDLNRVEMLLVGITRRSDKDKLVSTQNELDAKLLNEEAAKNKQQEDRGKEENSLRVDVNRINRILSLAGESLVESHRLNGIMDTFLQFKKKQHTLVDSLDEMRALLQDHSVSRIVKEQFTRVYSSALHLRQQLNEKVNELDAFDRRNALLIERLHEEIRSTRMRPFSALVQPFPRIVRDLGRSLKKDVKLRMSGLAVLVDRDVLERIDTSLKHLIQNSIDHGIETPQRRLDVGKTEEGSITLTVSQSAGMLFIVLEDDGRGVDLEALKKKIVKKGYVSLDQAERLDTASLLEYLFMPGFTTKEKANQISGRGVGLDLVRETVENLGGTVYVSSIVGEGTRFQILLPQMVSIMRVLLTHVDGELYSFPLSRVHRVVRLNRNLVARNNLGYCCYFDDGTYQLVTISQLLGYEANKLGRSIDVVLLKDGDQNIGIIVESILGQREVSVQRIDPDLGDIPGVNSASILDTGDLSLIFDTKELFSIYTEFQRDNRIELPELHVSSGNRILMVSESAGLREQAKRFLDAHQFHFITHRYDEHAYEKMLGQQPDCIVLSTDIGFTYLEETINKIKSSSHLTNTGLVIIVNERERRIHGEELKDLGVPLLDQSDISRSVFVNTIRETIAAGIQ